MKNKVETISKKNGTNVSNHEKRGSNLKENGKEMEIISSKSEFTDLESIGRTCASFKYSLIKTIVLILVWISLGLFLEITGPTLLDLKRKAHTNYETIARAVSGRSVGDFTGAVIGGFLVDKLSFHIDLIIAICLACAGIVTFAVPWAPQVELVWFLIVIQGLAEVIMNVAGNRIILQLWREKAASPMHALHLGFGIGSFIVPLIANPFLAVTEDIPAVNCTNTSTELNQTIGVSNIMTYIQFLTTEPSRNVTNYRTNCSAHSLDTENVIVESSIQYAYGIVSVPPLCLAVVFCLYHFYWHQPEPAQHTSTQNNASSTDKQSFKRKLDIINPATCTGGQFWYGLQIFFLMFLHFFNCVGGERLCSKFLRAFAIDHFNFSKDEGSYINTAFWISFSLGRFGGSVMGRWVPIRIMLLIEILGLFVSTLVLVLFGGTHSLVLWIFIQPVGFFTGQLFPTGMSWTDYHVELTGIGIMINCLGGGLGGLAFLWVIGFFYDSVGPRSFLYELLAYGIFACLIGFYLHFLGVTHGSRFDKENKSKSHFKDIDVSVSSTHL